MVEVHNHPEQALSDGPQALLPSMFKQLVNEVHSIHRVIAEAEANVSTSL
jgi:3-deoxy-D-arabino-heptulosonate 7-phosphate (DAHP) synthase